MDTTKPDAIVRVQRGLSVTPSYSVIGKNPEVYGGSTSLASASSFLVIHAYFSGGFLHRAGRAEQGQHIQEASGDRERPVD